MRETQRKKRQKTITKVMNETVPTEILQHILSWVGRRPQVPFVCRLWRAIAQDEAFCRHRYRSNKAVLGIDYATHLAREGLVGLLQWAHDEGCPVDDRVISAAIYKGRDNVTRWALTVPAMVGPRASTTAARIGRLDVLQHLYVHHLPWHRDVCRQAALGGYRKILSWLRDYGCPWDALTCSHAAKGGDWDLLDWLIDRGCPYDYRTMAAIARRGNLPRLMSLRARGCSWDAATCEAAAQGGHLEVLEWARANRCPWDRRSPRAAARGGHLAVLKWLRRAGCPWCPRLGRLAEISGNREVIKWTIKHRWAPGWLKRAVDALDFDLIEWALPVAWAKAPSYDDGPWRVAEMAALCGKQEVIEWLSAHGYERDRGVMDAAATNGHLGLVRWLHSKGYSWEEDTCRRAAGGGHWDTLLWLIDNGCPHNRRSVCEHAACAGRFDIVMSLAPTPSEATNHVCQMAARFGRIDVLAWCRANGLPWDGWVSCEAARSGHIGALKWVLENGCPGHWGVIPFLISQKRYDEARWACTMGCPVHHFNCLSRARASGADEAFVDWIKSQPNSEP